MGIILGTKCGNHMLGMKGGHHIGYKSVHYIGYEICVLKVSIIFSTLLKRNSLLQKRHPTVQIS